MSGPKHLWSGDWEHESRQPAAARPPTVDQEPDPQPAPAPSSGRFTRQQFAIALGTGVATAAVAITLIFAFGGAQNPKPHHHATTASNAPGASGQPQTSGGGGLNNSPTVTQSSSTTTVPTVTGPSATWMGMQIVTSPNGVVVSTVRLGSPADQAGFEPGDQIQSVDGHIIGSVSELEPDTSALKVGSEVTIEVMRSSVQLTSSLPMTQHPTIHP
ncbi:MAG TPA: PDZ domain-containing protein [Solirubrobacteraceae bacterium]|jgi:membrane-associated protease RseP (regulator of RpoE activity)|nr:PDZ domain-containing protein [Solirubrobacteraceae bacterium]